MISKYKHKNTTWVDMEDVAENELLEISEEYKIPKNYHANNQDFLCIEKDGIAKICLPFSFEDSANEDLVNFIIGDNFLITSRKKEIPELTKLSREFESESIPEKASPTPSFLFTQILKKLYKNIHEKLKDTKEEIEKIEKMISNDRERHAINKIWSLNKKLTKLKEMMKTHENMIISFKEEIEEKIGFKIKTEDISKEHKKIKSEIKNQKYILQALSDRNTASLLVKNGERLKTISTTLFLIITLTAIFLAMLFFGDNLM